MLVGAGATSAGRWTLESLEAGPRQRRAALHRQHHLQRLQGELRPRQGAGAKFQKIEVLEPSRDEAVQILQGLRSRYEEHHGVKFSDPALEAAVDLSRSTWSTGTCLTRPST